VGLDGTRSRAATSEKPQFSRLCHRRRDAFFDELDGGKSQFFSDDRLVAYEVHRSAHHCWVFSSVSVSLRIDLIKDAYSNGRPCLPSCDDSFVFTTMTTSGLKTR
jgi:hypothetical protein